jgi:glycosyltransferase involved in cell wall biosynthesis
VSLVREALSTLVSQTYPHWTCAVFDNASTEPLREVIDAFSDTRISYTRSDQFLPVTDSWNNAIDLARGEYILLIGDDDGLVPRALETIVEVVRVYENPDVIYSALYQFFHPGVAPWEPSGSVSRLRYGFFFSDRSETFRLDPKAARLAVAGSLEFRRNFTFNMQAFFFRRGFLDNLRRSGGKVFQSPFPDYYLANVALGLAQDIVVLPDPVSIAGVSRKSYGYTLFNNQSEKGDSLLATNLSKDRLYSKFSKYMLHGSSYDTNYALTMEHVEDALGSEAPTRINVGRYRRLQIFKGLGETSGLLGEDGKARSGYQEYLRPHLSSQELQWAEDLIRLGRCAAQGDGQALSTINRVADTVSMAAPAELAVHVERLSTGEFDSLPRLFAALRAGRLG